MVYTPDLDYVDDAPPGFDTARMTKMQLGIAEADTVARDASTVADQALADAASAQSAADEALSLVGTGGVHTVDDDVKRIYRAGTTPSDGTQPGDLVFSPAPSAHGPAAIPDLFGWYDASATGARDLGAVLPDVSGNDNHISWRSASAPAAVGRLNGLPAFLFSGNSRYSRPGTRTGPRTLSGVVRFDAILANDMPLFYTGGDVSIEFGVRSTGRLYVTFGGAALYNQPIAWDAAGQAYVSFILAITGTSATLWLNGQQVASSTVAGGGSYATLAISQGSGAFLNAAVGELAEHEVAVDSSQAAELAAYYRAKWRV